MNFNVYLNNDLADKVNNYIKAKNISRSKAISEALTIWLENDNKEWQVNFFDFASDLEFPDVKELRTSLTDDSSDPLA